MALFEYYYPTCLSYSQCLFLIQKEVSALIHLPVPLQNRLDSQGSDYFKMLESVWDGFLAFPYDALLVKDILESLGYVVSRLYNGLNRKEDDVYIVYKRHFLN